MKKLSLIMAVVMLLSSVFAVSVYAADKNVKTTKIDGITFEYRIIGNKYVEITDGAHFIPEQIDGYPVTIIGQNAFRDYYDPEDPDDYQVRDWVIPDTVTYIGDYAFYRNPELRNVKMPSSVVYIGEGAFSNCVNLKEINIPESVKKIEDYTFFECSDLKNITLHDEIYKIGNSAFFACSSLVEIDLPSELETLGDRAFYACSSLKSLDFSNSYVRVGSQCMGFYNKYFGDFGMYYPGETISEATTVKYKDFKIITSHTYDGNYTGSPEEYASKNRLQYLVISSSKNSELGSSDAGDSRTLYIDRENLTDYSTTTPKIIKITKKGKLTALQEGRAVVKVTLPNGKKYKGLFTVTNSPVLKKKITSGKNKGTYKKVSTVSVKKGKNVKVWLFGKAEAINNKYTSTSKAQIISPKSATAILIKGKAKGTSTVKIKVNGVKTLKLKVKVT